MGCKHSNLQSLVISPTPNETPSPIDSRYPASNEQSDRILENCIIVWYIHDSSIDVENEKIRLRQVVSFIKIFIDLNECLNYITNIKIEKVFLIIPNMNSFIHSIQYLPQIEKIYIFNTLYCQMEERSQQLFPLKSFHDIDTLCEQLQIDVDLCDLDLIDIIAASVSTQDNISSNESKKQENKFLYVQLLRELLFRFKAEKNAKNEFIRLIRGSYLDDDEQLRIIDDFEAHYRPQKTLRWLTRRCFLSKIMQRIQRTPEMDIHYKICFLIKDIYTQIKIFQENSSLVAEKNWVVYRGKTLIKDRFDTLIRNNIGGLLCFSGFFMADKDKEVAVDFVCQRLATLPHVIGILFEIQINSKIRSDRSPFLSFDQIDSDDTFDENGILFSMYTVFRIESIEQTTEKSINMWIVKLTLITDDDPRLLRIVSSVRSSEILANPLFYLGKFIMDRGEYEYAEHFLLELLNDNNVLNQPRRLARFQKGTGCNYMNKGEYTQALQHYQTALQASLNYLPSEHIELVSIYEGIGNCYYKQNDYFNALENYEKAFNIIKRNKHSMNDPLINDLNVRISTTRKLLNDQQGS